MSAVFASPAFSGIAGLKARAKTWTLAGLIAFSHLFLACGTDAVCPTGAEGASCTITTDVGPQPTIPSRTDTGSEGDVDVLAPDTSDTNQDTNDGTDTTEVADATLDDAGGDAPDASGGADTQTPADDTSDADEGPGDGASLTAERARDELATASRRAGGTDLRVRRHRAEA